MRLGMIVTALVALCLGVLTGGVLIGRAVAQQPPAVPRPRYQYVCYTKMEARIYEPVVLDRLNQLGAEGWRLIGRSSNLPANTSYSDVYCFERIY